MNKEEIYKTSLDEAQEIIIELYKENKQLKERIDKVTEFVESMEYCGQEDYFYDEKTMDLCGNDNTFEQSKTKLLEILKGE